MKIGIHPNTSWDDYFALDALNSSVLKKVSQSPMHARHAQVVGSSETRPQMMGTAKHCRLLEPETFSDLYAVAPESDRRRKAYKDFVLENANKNVLTAKEHDEIEAVAEAAHANELVASILAAPGQNEVTVVAEKEGVLVKARIDRICQWRGFTLIVDLKNMNVDLSNPWKIRGWMREYATAGQAAWYLDTLDLLAQHERRHMIVAIESTAPHGVKVLEVSPDWIVDARLENERCFRIWKECAEAQVYPGYPEEIEAVTMREEQ